MKTLTYGCCLLVTTFLFSNSAFAHVETGRTEFAVDKIIAESSFNEPTYIDTVKTENLTLITPVFNKGINFTLYIDSKGDKVFFPFERESRVFTDEVALMDFMKKHFSYDPENKEKGLSGTYLWEGASYFYDPKIAMNYLINDPILAFVGGPKGTILVAGKEMCIDPDGKCDEGYASYLEPVGKLTAPTQLDHCGREFAGTPVCVLHHTFWNKTWWFGDYVRHGVNARFTTWGALPSSVLDLSGRLMTAIYDPFGIIIVAPPTVGEDFAESAIFCYGNCDAPILDAYAMCGQGRVSDPDVSGTRETGNGPGNNVSRTTCP
ncbi:hypothetical protein Q4574_17425 [Aliiglaciecola sp. 3_MG-2023]|uniref:hypothetical protein n=1 Tax=Aliiglaciecola sp. 3_MG-2023 TaxID=3062644 RepID=UPI0026E35B10|nr:hypothetical protein [Aliiglaciecola sp. 3_MG-2023]MDO6695082.1 hypothetical protein [Aliiglaciecola sp. 3_MG-2023]